MTFPLTQPVAIFLLVLVIILLAPIIFRRLKIPYIVGMIIAGILVGPYGFNLLARDASFTIFGQVGILYLMFLASIEIDLYHLRQNWKKGLVFGLLTFAIPMAIGIASGRLALQTSWPTAVLFGSIYASHTLLTYPVINRFGLTNTRSVIIAVSSTVVAVLLALLALAAVTESVSIGYFSPLSLIWLIIKMIFYAVGVGILYPIITRRFFKSVSDLVSQYILILALVFISSLLAQLIGLESILGAFYAGLILNRFVPSRSGLMSRIEFVGNAIFIPYFLIGVGMLINVRAAVAGWSVAWAGLIMIVTSLGAKWLAAWTGQKIFGFSTVGRDILFGLTSGKAAATIAATMLGFQYGLIDEDMMNATVLMIIACCAVSSVVTDRAAKKLRINLTSEDLRKDSRQERRNAHQLVAVSNPLTAESIMKLAIYMRHPKNRIPIYALFVRNTEGATAATMGRNALRMAADTAMAADIPVKDIDRYDLNIMTGLVNTAKEQGASDIVIGMHHKSNIVDSFFGQMVESLLQATNKMVVMARCFIPVNTIHRVIVISPLKAEYETGFRKWVERMGNLGLQLGARISFVGYASTMPYIRGVLSDGDYDIRSEYHSIESGDQYAMLVEMVKEDDLLVVISARRGSVSYSQELESMPLFLEKYFQRHNISVIYPEQFGDTEPMPTPIDPLASNLSTTPSAWSWITGLRKRLRNNPLNLD